MGNKEKGAKTVRSIERAISVLECFDQLTPLMSVTELQKRNGLSRPTLYRILETLERRDVIRSRGEPQRFELGHAASRLAANWIGQDDFLRSANPVLRRLWDETNETVALYVEDPTGQKICIQEFQSRKALTFTRGIGFTEELAVGASGKAMLAYKKGAAKSPELANVRRWGVSVSEGEILEGAVAIAAPVFDRARNVKGSVCIFGPQVRLDEERRNFCIERVRAASEDISATLGCFVPTAAE